MKWLWLDLQSLKEENIDLLEHSQAFLGLLEHLFFTRPADRADRARASLNSSISYIYEVLKKELIMKTFKKEINELFHT